MRDDFRVVHKLDAATAAAFAQGLQRAGQPGSADPQGARPGASQHPQMSFQAVHQLSYEARQPGPGASYRGSQPGQYQQYEAPQPGPSVPVGRSHVGRGGQYEAPRPGFGDPYPNTPGTNQQLPPVASANPRPGNQLPPIAPVAQAPTNQRPPPIEPPYQMPGQNYNSAASQAMTPDVQQPMTWYRTGRSGPNSQAPQRGDVSEQETFDRRYVFTTQEREWLLDEGIYLEPGHQASREFYARFKQAFSGHRVPSRRRVMDEFNRMRM
ncbi:hypothetical protein INS49_007864 [Diaporthe citri]|uniref:uncharacterized protein n=1 Tax=Diaporthe citri TaxID=83186 RepID=UPI001C807A79|nr:uncharacterized protein INS49_007864 [Diaporthe citri]KAG6362770.1 hypothetical protein INS49_007864 [Diaporthe citri]